MSNRMRARARPDLMPAGKNYQVFFTPTPDFAPTMEAAGCYCCYRGKILLVKRQPYKSQGNTWGVPAGKLEKGENPIDAVIRELHEEVGFSIVQEELQAIATLYMRLPSLDYTYHMFFTRLASQLPIVLDFSENQEARWVTLAAAFKLPLMAGGVEALLCYQRFLATSPLLLR